MGLGGIYVWWNPDTLHRWLHKLGFKVEEVFIEGRKRTAVQDVKQLLRVVRNQSIFRVSLEHLLKCVEDIPWVRSAVVERVLPNVLYIRMCEREPIAIWSNAQRKHYIIDKDGTVILPLADFSNPKWSTLLKITGENAPVYVLDLHKALGLVQKLQHEISHAVFLRSGRWDIYFKQGMCLKLPEGDIVFGLQRFLGLRSRMPKNVKVVDLRAGDSILIEFEKPTLPPKLGLRTAKEKR